MYKEFYSNIKNIVNGTESKYSIDLSHIMARRLIIYKLGEIQMWWNSEIFTKEGLLYMKSMFPNSYPINMIITAMRTAKKVEREYLNNSNNLVSFYNLTDEIEDSIGKITSVICDVHDDLIKKIIDNLIDNDDIAKLNSVFNEIEIKKPDKIEPPIIYFGNIKYDNLFNNDEIDFKKLNNILQPLLLGYQNSEQRLLNVGYYNLE
ncbi:BrxE family protein [Clostridium sp. 001]|uniref:BrxE family protein n=1 Tax=Clostridium sp. 001 TaxID=1970093 RepID=UPI001C2C68D8|nr:BrxE family protein [Clostridium sp. 001]QXE17808.1 hypothetical protein B5S50_02515 [Clostridium sp. 001]